MPLPEGRGKGSVWEHEAGSRTARECGGIRRSLSKLALKERVNGEGGSLMHKFLGAMTLKNI